MAELGKLYLYTIAICFLFIAPGLSADDAWIPPRPEATKQEEKKIVQGCAFKAEAVFYVAQEKLYNHGTTDKLLAYLEANMSPAEYRINAGYMKWVGEWVDSNSYPTAHEYARALMYECVANSYEQFHVEPTKRMDRYLQRFEEELDNTEERLLPSNGQEYEA